MRKKLVVLIFSLVSWFFIADGYWVSQERSVRLCNLKLLEAIFSSASAKYKVQYRDADELKEIFNEHEWTLLESRTCAIALGAKGAMNHSLEWLREMAFWEIILLLPVVYRWGW